MSEATRPHSVKSEHDHSWSQSLHETTELLLLQSWRRKRGKRQEITGWVCSNDVLHRHSHTSRTMMHWDCDWVRDRMERAKSIRLLRRQEENQSHHSNTEIASFIITQAEIYFKNISNPKLTNKTPIRFKVRSKKTKSLQLTAWAVSVKTTVWPQHVKYRSNNIKTISR